ncbi:unnamed protein product [Medioppia subpectinata]|uniref:G-protein coupled receptors family 2 profile 2 domain-containing protein n=1 Tax=Medioppia subpectinata TaxID=1979941 RepID=A0A7R9PUK2_9ACAR|nr:unnamed protein product [Medioppia subpectinata]CAG2101859.1 unnamed protein product [Medioppia subpectinata]
MNIIDMFTTTSAPKFSSSIDCTLSFTNIKLYAALACINWMFIEGLLLHSRITISIFRKDAPFKLYYCVGWGESSLVN